MYIAIYVCGGSIDRINTFPSLGRLEEEMIEVGKLDYDPDTDDYKIFHTDNHTDCVFSYQTYLEEQEELNGRS